MKILALVLGFLAFTASSYGDMLGINITLVRHAHGATLVSLSSPESETNRQDISVQEAATVLRHIPFQKDAIFAVLYSGDTIPLGDLMPLLQAMSEAHIGIRYIRMGQGPNGTDTGNRK